MVAFVSPSGNDPPILATEPWTNPQADHYMAENLIVRHEVAVNSVLRLVDSLDSGSQVREFCLLNCW